MFFQKDLKAFMAASTKLKSAFDIVRDYALFDGKTLWVTDLDGWQGIDASFETDMAPFLIPRDLLKKAVGKLKSEFIELKPGQIIHSKGVVKFGVETKVENFPVKPVFKKQVFEICLEDAANLGIAAKYVAKDELRPVMNYVSFNSEHIAASDAHKLFFIDTQSEIEAKGTLPYYMAKDVCLKLAKGAFSLQESENQTKMSGTDTLPNHLLAKQENLSYIWKADMGYFPIYKNIIPYESSRVTISAKEVVEAANIVSLTANPAAEMGVFSNTAVSSQDIDMGTSSKIAPITNWPELQIGFKLPSLIDCAKDAALVTGNDEISFEYTTPDRAVLFGGCVLLMPMMIM